SVSSQTGAQPGSQSNLPQSDQSAQQQSSTSQSAAGSVEQVRGQVQQALQQQLSSTANNINVEVGSNNQITLTGTVNSEQDKDRAEQIAKSAAPGQTIVNNITIGSSSSTSVPKETTSSTGSALPQAGEAGAQSNANQTSTGTSASGQVGSSQMPSSQSSTSSSANVGTSSQSSTGAVSGSTSSTLPQSS